MCIYWINSVAVEWRRRQTDDNYVRHVSPQVQIAPRLLIRNSHLFAYTLYSYTIVLMAHIDIDLESTVSSERRLTV